MSKVGMCTKYCGSSLHGKQHEQTGVTGTVVIGTGRRSWQGWFVRERERERDTLAAWDKDMAVNPEVPFSGRAVPW